MVVEPTELQINAPQELLNTLLRLAPLSPETADALKQKGWESFFSFRPFEPNGAPNMEDIQLGLDKIEKTVPQTTRDWELQCARSSDIPEEERLYELLKKKTEQREQWENNSEQTTKE